MGGTLQSDQVADELSQPSHLSSQMRLCRGLTNGPPRKQHAIVIHHQAVPRFLKLVKLVRLKIDLACPGL